MLVPEKSRPAAGWGAELGATILADALDIELYAIIAIGITAGLAKDWSTWNPPFMNSWFWYCGVYFAIKSENYFSFLNIWASPQLSFPKHGTKPSLNSAW